MNRNNFLIFLNMLKILSITFFFNKKISVLFFFIILSVTNRILFSIITIIYINNTNKSELNIFFDVLYRYVHSMIQLFVTIAQHFQFFRIIRNVSQKRTTRFCQNRVRWENSISLNIGDWTTRLSLIAWITLFLAIVYRVIESLTLIPFRQKSPFADDTILPIFYLSSFFLVGLTTISNI